MKKLLLYGVIVLCCLASITYALFINCYGICGDYCYDPDMEINIYDYHALSSVAFTNHTENLCGDLYCESTDPYRIDTKDLLAFIFHCETVNCYCSADECWLPETETFSEERPLARFTIYGMEAGTYSLEPLAYYFTSKGESVGDSFLGQISQVPDFQTDIAPILEYFEAEDVNTCVDFIVDIKTGICPEGMCYWILGFTKDPIDAPIYLSEYETFLVKVPVSGNAKAYKLEEFSAPLLLIDNMPIGDRWLQPSQDNITFGICAR